MNSSFKRIWCRQVYPLLLKKPIKQYLTKLQPNIHEFINPSIFYQKQIFLVKSYTLTSVHKGIDFIFPFQNQ